MLRISGDEISLEVDTERGSRISSLQWKGLEFVVKERPSLMDWGMYAMVPWAGRIRDGLVKDDFGEIFSLPTNWDPPHAEHGFGFYLPWEIAGDNATRLSMPEPYSPAYAEQKFEIHENSLRWSVNYFSNGCTLPAWVGFHPWFARSLTQGQSGEVSVSAEKMLVRGNDMLPTGEYCAPKEQPWDDAFTGVATSPSIHWRGAAKVTISSPSPWWVIYTEDSEGLCVEPQTAPPDACNLRITGSHSAEVVFSFTKN